MKYLIPLFFVMISLQSGFSQFSLYRNGVSLKSNSTVQVRRGDPLRIVAVLQKVDADMDDIDNFPDEVREWKDSAIVGSNTRIEYFDWEDPAFTLDTMPLLNLLEFRIVSDTTGDSSIFITVEIIDPEPTETDLNPDNISFIPTNSGGAATYGIEGISLIDTNFDMGTFSGNELSILSPTGESSILNKSGLSINLLDSPRAHLHIKQNALPALALENDGDGNDTYIFDIRTNDIHVLYDADGAGTDSVAVKITELDNETGEWGLNSDRRLKKQIKPLQPVLNRVLNLAPKEYLYNHQSDQAPFQVGFIAQEVIELFPNLVKKGEDNYYSLHYEDFGVLAIKAIQEQQEIIQSYRNELDELNRQVKRLTMLMDGQKTALADH